MIAIDKFYCSVIIVPSIGRFGTLSSAVVAGSCPVSTSDNPCPVSKSDDSFNSEKKFTEYSVTGMKIQKKCSNRF